MKAAREHCRSDWIDALVLGALPEDLEGRLSEHLDDCAHCRDQIEAATSESGEWNEVRAQLTEQPFDGASALLSTGQVSRTIVDRSRGEAGMLAGEVMAPSIQHVLKSLAPTDDPMMLGRLGHHEVQAVIGAGGMGVVLKAFDPSLDRMVAMKVLAPHLATSGAARQRFAREAKAAAAVLHPNVVAIHAVSDGGDTGLPYLVMPYVRGTTLQARIDQQGGFNLTEILQVAVQVADGLSAAHQQGLVHRDIKPANIMLEEGVERVSIMDFGLARTVDDATLTQSGVIAGTPQYMSPEQARGDTVDERSDLFSLGSLIYIMSTGHPPFRAETAYGILRRITDENARSIRDIRSDLPSWLEVLVKKLHAKSAADRYQSADEVASVLRACLAHVQSVHSPLPESLIRPRSPHQPRFIFAVAAATVVGLLWALWPADPSVPNEMQGNRDSAQRETKSLVADTPSQVPYEDESVEIPDFAWDENPAIDRMEQAVFDLSALSKNFFDDDVSSVVDGWE